MDAQRHHIGQQVKRRRDVQQAVLDSPRTEAVNLMRSATAMVRS